MNFWLKRRRLQYMDLFFQEEYACGADRTQIRYVSSLEAAHCLSVSERLLKGRAEVICAAPGLLGTLRPDDPPLSLLIEHKGSAQADSSLESLMADAAWFDAQTAQRAVAFASVLKREKLFLHCAERAFDPKLLAEGSDVRVLIADEDPQNLAGSGFNSAGSAAQALLQEVSVCYPQAEIYLLSSAGATGADSLFAGISLPPQIKVLKQRCAPFSLLPYFTVLVTVSSVLGFAALLHGGIKVHCLGRPFYAGYGLTTDKAPSLKRLAAAQRTADSLKRQRRQLRLSLGRVPRPASLLRLKLIAALYFKLSRYVNPITQERCEAEEAAQLLVCQAGANNANRGLKAVIGVKRWKRPILRAFLNSTDGRTVFVRDKDKALELCRTEAGTLVQWASKLDLKVCAAAREQQIPLLFIEDGFIRSVGLGSDHFRPFSLALDKHGIYYDPQSHSDLERLLNALPRRPDLAQLKERARRLISFLTAGGLTKYNVGSSGDVLSRRICTLAQGRKVILVPGQVEGDASIKASNTGISTNLELLQAVRASHQHAFIIFKIHPDVWAQNRPGLKLTEQYRTYADLIAADCSDLYAAADEVCVLSSQSGFEALLRRRPVTVYGRPFYAGWGLTQDKESFPRRTVRLSLEELAAGVLLLYPRYYDWQTGLFCRAEDVCRRIEEQLQQKKALGVRVKAAAVKGMRRALRRTSMGKG